MLHVIRSQYSAWENIIIFVRDKFIDKRELLITEMEKKAHELEVEDDEDFGVGKCVR